MRSAVIAALLAAGCGSDVAPAAVVLEASPTSLVAASDAEDDLTIRVHYSDGDGDLGGGRAEVTDCRADDVVTVLPLPPLASPAAVEQGVAIEGELDLLVADVGLPAPAAAPPAACLALGVSSLPEGTAVFCVVLVDAAGHSGAGDCTAPITVR